MAEEKTAAPVEAIAEKPLSRYVEQAMTNAVYDILNHEQDIVDADVPVEKVDEIATKAAERAKKEALKNEAEDPIRRFVVILHEQATTPDEELYASNMEERMEDIRNEIKKALRAPMIKARHSAEGFDLEKTLQQLATGKQLPYGSLQSGDKPSIELPLLETYTESNTRNNSHVRLNSAYETRVLLAIGALPDGETIEDLFHYPKRGGDNPFQTGPYYSDFGSGHAGNLPTFDENIKVTVTLDERHDSVHFRTSDIEVIGKIVNIPTS